MTTPTYDLLDSTTLASAASSVTFTSIDQSYGDLVLVANYTIASADTRTFRMTFNSDSGTNYSYVEAYGDGSTTDSFSQTSQPRIQLQSLSSGSGLYICQIMDYSATDKHKTVLARANTPVNGVLTSTWMTAGRWADTSAISSLAVDGFRDYPVGATFALYGIAK